MVSLPPEGPLSNVLVTLFRFISFDTTTGSVSWNSCAAANLISPEGWDNISSCSTGHMMNSGGREGVRAPPQNRSSDRTLTFGVSLSSASAYNHGSTCETNAHCGS
jgi:hypothetical protein